MSGLADTLARLKAAGGQRRSTPASRLTKLERFGSNPGDLDGQIRVPTESVGKPLVVVLHGCTQSAASYDAGTGWSRLADKYGFAVLFPQQQRENNAHLCFNWFEPGDTRRDSGEAASIIQMVDTLITRYKLDPNRVFVTGLSAGGAMTVALLATYPDRFAGGAVIAGLPFAGAAGVAQAFERMQARSIDAPGLLERHVRQASQHAGPWPTLSIWHGSADHVVSPKNVEAMLDQWRGLHGVRDEPNRTDLVNGYPRRTWTDSTGRDVIEVYSITGMGHGTPIGRPGVNEHGAPGPHIVETDISSSLAIGSFWELIVGPGTENLEDAAPARMTEVALSDSAGKSGPSPGTTPMNADASSASGIQAVIEKALRAAGLMK